MRSTSKSASSRLRRTASWLAWLAFVWLVLLPGRTSAGGPVIEPGREQEVVGLLAPHALGDEVSPGWVLHSTDIEKARIVVWLAGPEEKYAAVLLDPPGYGPPDARKLPGFDMSIGNGPPGSEAAIERVAERVAANDQGEFWAEPVVADEHIDRYARHPGTWLEDGLLIVTCLVLGLGALVVKTSGGPGRGRDLGILAGITVSGVLLRLWLPVEVPMAPWPYGRVLITAGLVFDGPVLGRVSSGPVFLSDVIHESVRFFSFLAPLAIYVHARYLLADRRAALLAAGLIVVLPLHLRFSASDAAFIPSITISSLAFALTHAATRETRRALVVFAVLLLPFTVALMFLVRPLNLIYFPLLVGTAFVNEGLHGEKVAPSRRRIALVAVLLAAVTAGVGVPHLLSNYAPNVSEGLGLRTLTSAAGLVFDLELNAVIRPDFMPPGLTVLAGLGAWHLLRRERKRLGLFLTLWLLGFFVAHAYVVPRSAYMQARYHLHLVVPFCYLATAGIEWLWAELGRRGLSLRLRAGVLAGVGAYLAASPLIHRDFVRDTEFDSMREWVFVHELRDRIPAGCTVIEHTGFGNAPRLMRVGAYAQAGLPENLFRHVPLADDEEGSGLSELVVDTLRGPPECLMFYQGLPCFSAKRDDAPIAPACEDVIGWLPSEEVARTSFPVRVYDENLGEHLGDVDQIELVLYRFDTSGRR